MVPRAWALAVLVCTLVLAVPQTATPAAAADVSVTLVAAGFQWHRNSPSAPAAPTIVANAGDGLNLTIENQDASLHTFDFPHFGVSMGLTPGQTYFVNVTTTPADVGVWQFWCAPHSSGTNPENHTGMVGWFDLRGPDVVPPEIRPMAPASVALNTSFVIQANVTDNTAVQTVMLNYTDVHGMNQNVTMSFAGGLYSATIPAQDSAGTVSFFIWADDALGNTNRTATANIAITPASGPPPPAADSTGWIVGGIALLLLLALAVLLMRRKKPAGPR